MAARAANLYPVDYNSYGYTYDIRLSVQTFKHLSAIYGAEFSFVECYYTNELLSGLELFPRPVPYNCMNCKELRMRT